MPYTKAQYTYFKRLYGGMNIQDTPDVAMEKGQAEYVLNVYNTPEGGIARFFGRSKHNSSAIGAAAEITGIYELKLSSPKFYCIAEDKFYVDSSGTWGDKTGAVSITDSKNNLWSFSRFQDHLIATSLSRDAAIEHDGGAGDADNVSNMPAVKFNATLANRLLAFNTQAQPKLGYWSGLNDRTSWDTTNDFLNYKESEADNEEISGVKEHLNNIIVAKESSVFRVYHTGTMPPFKYYCIGRKNGLVSGLTMLSIPAAGIYPPRLIWMGKDNFYQLIGDEISSIGDDIKPFFSEGAPFQINASRLKYCIAGIIKEKNLYICSFSSGSSTTHDSAFILDYKNMMWGLCNFKMNCFGIREISGRDFLYSGTYNGFVGKHDPSVYNDLSSAYNSYYWTWWVDFGDPQAEKKIRYIVAFMKNTGFDLEVEYQTNLGTTTGTFTSTAEVDLLGVDFTLGSSTLGGADLVENILEVLQRFRRIKLRFNMTNADKYFRLYALGALWSPVKGYRIGT